MLGYKSMSNVKVPIDIWVPLMYFSLIKKWFLFPYFFFAIDKYRIRYLANINISIFFVEYKGIKNKLC